MRKKSFEQNWDEESVIFEKSLVWSFHVSLLSVTSKTSMYKNRGWIVEWKDFSDLYRFSLRIYVSRESTANSKDKKLNSFALLYLCDVPFFLNLLWFKGARNKHEDNLLQGKSQILILIAIKSSMKFKNLKKKKNQ